MVRLILAIVFVIDVVLFWSVAALIQFSHQFDPVINPAQRTETAIITAALGLIIGGGGLFFVWVSRPKDESGPGDENESDEKMGRIRARRLAREAEEQAKKPEENK